MTINIGRKSIVIKNGHIFSMSSSLVSNPICSYCQRVPAIKVIKDALGRKKNICEQCNIRRKYHERNRRHRDS